MPAMKRGPRKISVREVLKRVRKPVPKPTARHKGKKDLVTRKRLKKELYDIMKKGQS